MLERQTDSNFCIINEELLKYAIIERSKAQKNAVSCSESESIEKCDENIHIFTHTQFLELSFQNVWKIGNLQSFQNLTKLCLDNNNISKMECLENLSQLSWLDLSFNKISKIEGLDHLRCLKDLSLFHNQIECIENMDSQLQSLQCLSLGHNRINFIHNERNCTIVFSEDGFPLLTASYLRRFQKLNVLTLMQNPISKVSSYKKNVILCIPTLVYLDYGMVINQDLGASNVSKLEQIHGKSKTSVQQSMIPSQLSIAEKILKSIKPILSQIDSRYDDAEKNQESASMDQSFFNVENKVKKVLEEFEESCKKANYQKRVLIIKNQESFQDKLSESSKSIRNMINNFIMNPQKSESIEMKVNNLNQFYDKLIESELVHLQKLNDAFSVFEKQWKSMMQIDVLYINRCSQNILNLCIKDNQNGENANSMLDYCQVELDHFGTSGKTENILLDDKAQPQKSACNELNLKNGDKILVSLKHLLTQSLREIEESYTLQHKEKNEDILISFKRDVHDWHRERIYEFSQFKENGLADL